MLFQDEFFADAFLARCSIVISDESRTALVAGRGWKVVPLAQLMIIASHLIRLAGRILEPPRDCKLPTWATATAARGDKTQSQML